MKPAREKRKISTPLQPAETPLQAAEMPLRDPEMRLRDPEMRLHDAGSDCTAPRLDCDAESHDTQIALRDCKHFRTTYVNTVLVWTTRLERKKVLRLMPLWGNERQLVDDSENRLPT
ncbi:MAG TPA: hypothetical protein VNP98_04210 [Chthoniobacterales bacterium]|nr:hypothetical protein [Chthoniobacterales bacterium]